MLVRNPYDSNSQLIDNDEYLNFENFFRENNHNLPKYENQNYPFEPINLTKQNKEKQKYPSNNFQNNQNAMPGPPPSFTPKQNTVSKNNNPSLLKVSPGSIRPCKYQYVYMWLTNGNSFWAWLTNIDHNTASGFRWNGYRWVYFGIDLNRVESFECYGFGFYRKTDNVISNIRTQKLAPQTFDIEYPYIDGMKNEDVENIINSEIVDTVDDLLLSQVLVPEKVDFKKVTGAYEIPLDSYGILSIFMSISTLVNQENVPRITFNSLTVDLNTGETYDFDDLFNSKFNYKTALNEIVKNKVNNMNIKFVVPYDGITDTQKFYLTPEELVLYYQVDEYTPSSEGIFRIPIPYSEISNYLYPGSPINKIINQSNISPIPQEKPQSKPIPFTEGGSAMGPEYLGTYTGEVPND